MSNVIVGDKKIDHIPSTSEILSLMCSVYQAPSYEPSLILLGPFSTEFAYLSMLFILEMVCTRPSQEYIACSNKQSGRNHASNEIRLIRWCLVY